MGRIQPDDPNQISVPTSAPATAGQPPPELYPPQPPLPSPQYNVQQQPTPPHVAHTMQPPSILPQPQIAGNYAFHQGNTGGQYNPGLPGSPAPAQVMTTSSPLHPSVMQQNYAYNNGGGTNLVPRQNGAYLRTTGIQIPKLWPGSSNRGYVGNNPWNTGLFDCMEDPSNAFITALFPCITFGQIADVLDNGNTTCVTSGIIYAFSPCMLSRPYRTKLRRMYGLVEAPAADWMVHTLFEHCSLCQEYRELKSRGIDPVLGYLGNKDILQNQQQASAAAANSHRMVPPQNQIMS